MPDETVKALIVQVTDSKNDFYKNVKVDFTVNSNLIMTETYFVKNDLTGIALFKGSIEILASMLTVGLGFLPTLVVGEEINGKKF